MEDYAAFVLKLVIERHDLTSEEIVAMARAGPSLAAALRCGASTNDIGISFYSACRSIVTGSARYRQTLP
jgi:hypothetical protein